MSSRCEFITHLSLRSGHCRTPYSNILEAPTGYTEQQWNTHGAAKEYDKDDTKYGVKATIILIRISFKMEWEQISWTIDMLGTGNSKYFYFVGNNIFKNELTLNYALVLRRFWEISDLDCMSESYCIRNFLLQ